MDDVNNKNIVSYSQYSKYKQCPYSWYLDYIENKRTYDHNLILSFGNAIHTIFQKYIETLYTKGTKEAETLDLKKLFIDFYIDEITEENIKYEESELHDFINDGVEIIDEFLSKSNLYRNFPPNKYEFIGVEKELNIPLINDVNYSGYLDLVLKEKQSGIIKIIDFKTSTKGWRYELSDEIKLSQLKLYKALYSKKYNVPLNKIQVEFFILKRKIYEDCKYNQSRIQIHVPITTQTEISNIMKKFESFITEAFTPDGQYNKIRKYPKTPGKNNKNCKYCHYKDNICDSIPDPI